MEVLSPGSKGVQTYIMNRLLVYMYREFRAIEKRGSRPFIRADELSAQFPSLSEAFLRKRLKHCADLQVFLETSFNSWVNSLVQTLEGNNLLKLVFIALGVLLPLMCLS